MRESYNNENGANTHQYIKMVSLNKIWPVLKEHYVTRTD